MKIGIVGNGFVGKATGILSCKDIEIMVYDIKPELCSSGVSALKDILKCDFIFLSLPTPMSNDGSCYLKIVENMVSNIKDLKYKGFLVLRSTVPVGTSDELGIYFMPEFLTEKNYLEDFKNNKEWIFGLAGLDTDDKFKDKILRLFNLAFKNGKINYNKISFLTNKEAEMVKLFRNCYLSTKLSFCNEIYRFCEKQNIEYENVRNIACNDERIGHSHSNVPGHDGKFGFGGTCFPKDLNSLIYQMDKVNVNYPLLYSVKKRNEEIDRTEKDWTHDKGRAVT